ncbi:hypothetical protein PCASD_17132 [Puccinia coronata f. sp. avenae]|uniref:Uncharacterized protein n=1 Tax=Puccinia coronata f. sp. avenae TaxID=200324 RepID=A0A2N5SXD7_9BASI|nr:hypothetical protein PCASD_17132 [Puccinia coronata f. sp. avenae]
MLLFVTSHFTLPGARIVEGNSLHPSTIQHLANRSCLNAPVIKRSLDNPFGPIIKRSLDDRIKRSLDGQDS